MPIKRFTEMKPLGAGLPRIAKLYKGDERPEEGNRPGKDLNYFRIEFEEPYAHLRPVWEMMYGKEPAVFENVFFPAPTIDEAMESWMEEWVASKRLHQCDGDEQHTWYNAELGIQSTARIPCASPACKCKHTGRLKLWMPDFMQEAGVFGYLALNTHSQYDILTLVGYMHDILRLHGRLDGVPFILGRAPREVSVPKPNGKPGERIKVKKSLLYLRVTEVFARHILIPAIAAGGAMPALPAPQPDQLPTNVARELLGGGGKQRRMGVEPPTQQGQGEEAETPVSFLVDLTRRTKFLAWAKTQLRLNDADVYRALNIVHAMSNDGVAMGDWDAFVGSEKLAMSACVAAAGRYDADEINALTSSSALKLKEETRHELYELTCDIAERYQSREVDESDEILDAEILEEEPEA